MSDASFKDIYALADLLALDERIDREVCGISLEEPYQTHFAAQGAHDPTPTPYFVLDELFGFFEFDENSHLLDVGCGTGRVLAHFLRKGYPGKATGVELDPQLAYVASSWAERHQNLAVIQGNALELDLAPYTAFNLFNPFDPNVLQQFIEAVEAQVPRDCTVVHMSDNGDTWRYIGRDGWTQLATGAVTSYRNARGYHVKVYDTPQHYSVWRHEANLSL